MHPARTGTDAVGQHRPIFLAKQAVALPGLRFFKGQRRSVFHQHACPVAERSRRQIGEQQRLRLNQAGGHRQQERQQSCPATRECTRAHTAPRLSRGLSNGERTHPRVTTLALIAYCTSGGRLLIAVRCGNKRRLRKFDIAINASAFLHLTYFDSTVFFAGLNLNPPVIRDRSW